MKALQERAEALARAVQQKRIDEIAATIAANLPRATVEKLVSGISVRDLRVMERWLNESELRFMTRSGR